MTELQYNKLLEIYDTLKRQKNKSVAKCLAKNKILEDLEFLLVRGATLFTPVAEYSFTPNK